MRWFNRILWTVLIISAVFVGLTKVAYQAVLEKAAAVAAAQAKNNLK